MAAIYVAQALHLVIIFSKEESGVGAFIRVLVKHLIHGPQQVLWPIERDCALTAEIRLQIGHQKSGCDSFPCDVANHQTEAFLTELKEIVVIAADLASLDANTCVFECSNGRQSLREESCLNLFRDIQ